MSVSTVPSETTIKGHRTQYTKPFTEKQIKKAVKSLPDEVTDVFENSKKVPEGTIFGFAQQDNGINIAGFQKPGEPFSYVEDENTKVRGKNQESANYLMEALGGILDQYA